MERRTHPNKYRAVATCAALAATVTIHAQMISLNVDVSTNDVGRFTSSQIDRTGSYGTAYYDATAQDLKYFYGGSAIIVDSTGNVGQYACLKYNNTTPYIAYLDATNNALKLAYQSSPLDWTRVVVTSSGVLGYIAFDISRSMFGQIWAYIAYIDETSTLVLASARAPFNTWTRTPIGRVDRVRPALDVDDETGNVYLTARIDGDLQLIVAGGGSGRAYPIETMRSVGAYSALLVNPDPFMITVAYYADSSLWFALSKDPRIGFETYRVDNTGDVGQYVSLAGNSWDLVRLAYYDATTQTPKVARMRVPGEPDAWWTMRIDTMTAVGEHTSICLTTGTVPLVAIGYYDRANGNARVTAWFNGNPSIRLNPTALSFSYQVGDLTPLASTISIGNNGEGMPLVWTSTTSASWATISPAAGALGHNASTTTVLTVNPTGLSTGTYTATVTIISSYALNSPQTLTITLNVIKPIIAFTRSGLEFSVVQGAPNPPAQTFGIRNSGDPASVLRWTAQENVAWMALSSTFGATAGQMYSTVTVSVDAGGLPLGVYRSSITVADPGAMNSPQIFPVTLTIVSSAWPTISLSTTVLSFSSIRDSTFVPAAQQFGITNTGVFGSTLVWSASKNALWLTLSSTAGTLLHGASTMVAVSVDPAGLPAGVYHATVTVSDPAANNSPQHVLVRLTILGKPTIGLSLSSMTFTSYVTSPSTKSGSVTLTNTGDAGSTLYWSASDNALWLTVSPSSGALAQNTSQNLTLTINPSGLPTGVYVGTVTVVDPSATNSPQRLRVILEVLPEPPCTIAVVPSSLSFYGLLDGNNPENQQLQIQNVGPEGSILRWSATENAVWLALSTGSGTTPYGGSSNLTVSVNTLGLPEGTYTTNIIITASNCTNSPYPVPVQMVITSTAYPTIALNRSSISFSAQQGGPDPAPQTFRISNSGLAGSTLTWTATDNAAWLTLVPTSGSIPTNAHSTVTVTASVGGLSAGVYIATITISDPQATNNPQHIIVSLTVSSSPLPAIGLSRSSLTFTATAGGAHPAQQTFTVTNTGSAGSLLNWSATETAVWLELSPTSGVPLAAGSSATITVSAYVTGLTTGTHTATITVADPLATNNPQTVAVAFTVLPVPVPAIGLSRSSVTFRGTAGYGNPPAQSVTVSNIGVFGSTLTFAVTETAAWLTVAPASGTVIGGGPATELTLSVDTVGLATGTYQATITIADPAAINNPQTIAVSLILDDQLHPTIGLSNTSFAFTATVGGANPAAQTLAISNHGVAGSTLVFTVSGAPAWLSVTPSSGFIAAGSSATVALAVAITELSSGTHTATLSVIDPNATNSPQTVAVTLTINPAPSAVPAISLNRTVVSFSATSGGSTPPPQTVVLTNTGDAGSSLAWTVSDDASWLSVAPISGTLAQGDSENLVLTVDPAGLAPGSYSATLIVASVNAANSPQAIAVTLTISAPPAVSLPVSPGEVKILGGENGYVFSGRNETIRFVLNPKESGAVRFCLYSLRGIMVWESERVVSAGAQQFDWAVVNRDGQKLASGIYLLTVKGAGLEVRTKLAVRN